MATITITPFGMHLCKLTMKGLRVSMNQDLIRDYAGGIAISLNSWDLNPRTAQISPKKLISVLEEIHDHIEITKIKIDHFEMSADELFQLLQERINF